METTDIKDDLSSAQRRVEGVPLWTKIFSIALVLLVLMLAVSAASMVMVDQLRHQLQTQASVFEPLGNRIADLETLVLESEIVVERMRSGHGTGAAHTVDIDRVEAEFNRLNSRMTETIARAHALTGQVTHGMIDSSALAVAASVKARLEEVEKTLAEFRFTVAKLMEIGEQNNLGAEEVLDEILLQQEKDIYSSLELVRGEIQSFVQSSLALVLKYQTALTWLIGLATGLATLVGLLLASLIARRIVRPVHELVVGMHDVQDGNLNTSVNVSTRDELAWLAVGFNEMVEGLRAKERITDTFGKYVDARVVEGLIGNPELTKPGGDRRTMTIFFSDLAGFTGISEKTSPDALVRLLNEYFSDMAEPIRDKDGVIDKFIGDAIMAYWGMPFVPEQQQASAAVSAALAQRELIRRFRQRVPDILGVKLPDMNLDMRIGIATGPALVGTVGSMLHRNYTVMGDAVNLASRLEGACKEYGVRILVDQETRSRCEDIEFREIDALRVKGRKQPVHVYQPLAMKGDLEAELSDAVATKGPFADGLSAYRSQDLGRARSHFEKCLAIWPKDAAASTYLSRLDVLEEAPFPKDWDGVWILTKK